VPEIYATPERPDADFDDADRADAAVAFKEFIRECDLAWEAVASFPSPACPRRGGHADLLRERIDGAAGV
jgi:hypothetical protein